jgi:hypothetical protein
MLVELAVEDVVGHLVQQACYSCFASFLAN